MKRYEKAFVIFYMIYMIIYIPTFTVLAAWSEGRSTEIADQLFRWIIPFHLFGMGLSVPLFIIVIRDRYKREFPNPNSKVTWALLIVGTGGIGLYVYAFKYGFRPRPTIRESSPTALPITEDAHV